MLSKETKLRLVHAVTDKKTAEEVEKRLISLTPADPAASQAILASLDQNWASAISERMTEALAGDDRGAAGRELAQKLNAMVKVLKAHAESGDVAAAKNAMGSQQLSTSSKFCLVHALADQKAADELESAYNAMISAVQSIS